MEWNLKRCSIGSTILGADRLTSLPDDLLTRILSMLSTKDAAVTQVLSNRMRRAFCSLTSLDLDDSPVSHCEQRPHLVERFCLFESFVDSVFRKFSGSLTRFRFCMGGNTTPYSLYPNWHRCKEACRPNPQPARLYKWISYPLAHCSCLRELDLSFHVRYPSQYNLPLGVFTCESLEVLKLDSNLQLNGAAEIPVIRLPNLKLLHLHSFVFTEDDLVTKLVSNCPALEDLSMVCLWEEADRLIISSHSLRRLDLCIKRYEEEKNSDIVVIDTPNLQYLSYSDNLAYSYSFAHSNSLVEAFIYIDCTLQFDDHQTSFQKLLSLVRAVSNVQRLNLHGCAAELFHFVGGLEDQLPVFRNLKTLNLSPLDDLTYESRWDIVLMLILHSSPLLEALIFTEGLFSHVCRSCDFNVPEKLEVVALEAEGLRTTEAIPLCLQSHLKRIVINQCCGCDQELNVMKFLLGNASVLKDFVLCLTSKADYAVRFDAPNLNHFKNKIEEMPRASNSCSIIYSAEPTFI